MVTPAEDDATEMALGGLSLEQYAGVSAALTEKFPLSDILAQEGIDLATWPAASRAWTEAIADAPDLHMLFLQMRRTAEDCLARPISPLDDDPAAWTGLLGALALSEKASSIVEALGVTMRDLARLGRHWKRRMEADPKLNKEIEQLAPTAVPPKTVHAGPRQLRPFPWSPRGGDTRLVLLDDKGKPLSRQRFIIDLDDGSQRTGVTDEDGKAKLDLPSGGKIRFPGVSEVSQA